MTGALNDWLPEGALVAEPALVTAVTGAESNFKPNAISPRNAKGLMQVRDIAARDMGLPRAPMEPAENTAVGTAYLNKLLNKYGGDRKLALMAYNWGPTALDGWIAGGRTGPVPQETRDYVVKVLSSLNPVRAAQAAEVPAAAPAAAAQPVDDWVAAADDWTAPAEDDWVAPADDWIEEGAVIAAEPEAPGVISSAASGLRSGFRALGEQASTLFHLGTGSAAETPPPLPDELDQRYAGKSFPEKAADLSWWASLFPKAAVTMAPMLGGAYAGAAAGTALFPGAGTVAGLVGGGLSAGLVAGLQSLADSYNEAKSAKKDHDEALGYAANQAVVNGTLTAATAPVVAWGITKGPLSYLWRQMTAQPAVAAGQQGVTNVIAKESGIDPNREITAGMPEAAIVAGTFQAPTTAKIARSLYREGRRVGEEPPPPPPGQPVEGGPQTGQRFNLGLEESTSDPATGQTTRTVTPEDVTVQGFDPATGLVTLTLDNRNGAQLGPMALVDFERLKTGSEAGPPPTEGPPAAKVGPTEEEAQSPPGTPAERVIQPKRPWGTEPTEADIVARDAAIAAAEAEGRVVRDVEPEGPSPFARPAKPREEEAPRPRLDLGDDEARVREVAEEADRRAADTGDAETSAAKKIKQPFDMSELELQNALDEAKMDDHAKMLKALGSEEAVKEFNRLDRMQNSQDPMRADEGVRRFNEKFGDLSPEQERLIYGIGETGPQVEDLKRFLDARLPLEDASNEEVARVLTRGMLNVRADELRTFMETGEGSFLVQAEAAHIQTALQEMARRGMSKAQIEGATAAAMAKRGFSREDALEVLSAFRQGREKPAQTTAPEPRAIAEPQRALPKPEQKKPVVDAEAARVDAEERAAIQDESATIRKTETGAYEATAKDGQPLGAYQTRKAATEAVADKVRSVRNADAALESAKTAADAAAKAFADQTPKRKVPEMAAKIAERLDPRRGGMKELGVAEAKGTLMRSLAAADEAFAGAYSKVERRFEDQYRNFRDFFWQSKPRANLSTPSRQQVDKAGWLARLQGRDIIPSGARLVIVNKKVGDRPHTGEAIVNPETGKPWIEAGETVRLSKEETEAFFAMKATMQNVWRRHIEATARKMGYEGDIQELRDAVTASKESPEAREAALKEYGRLLDITDLLMQQERPGYLPSMRYGDVQVSVLPRGENRGRTSAGDLGGKEQALWSQRVDSGTLKKSLIGRRFTSGDYGPKVKAVMADLQKRFPDADVVARYVSEAGHDDLSIPALMQLAHGLSQKNPELRDAIWKAFEDNIATPAKAGFRQHAENIPGHSVDFDRVITDYLHHAARVLPMIEHRNGIAGAVERVIGNPTKKIPAGSHPSVQRATKRWMEYVDDPGTDYAAIRKLGFGWWLWASPSSALVQLSQTPLVTIAGIGKWGGYARTLSEATKAASSVLVPNRLMFKKHQWTGEGGIISFDLDHWRGSEQDRTLLRGLERDGSLQAQVVSDMTANNVTKSPAFRPMAKIGRKVYESGASVVGAAEISNRIIAGLIAARLTRWHLDPERGAAHVKEFKDKIKAIYAKNELFRQQIGDNITPETMAKWAIRETQFDPSKYNTPEIMRGAGAPIFQFKKFTANYVSLLHRQFRYEGASGKIAGTMMLASLVAAAGLKGLPFAEDAVDAIDWATRLALGVDPDVEVQMHDWLRNGLSKVGGEHWGNIGAEMLMNGISRYTTGMDWGQRVGQGRLAPRIQNPVEVLGPAAGAIAQMFDAAPLARVGQAYQAAAKALPKGIGNIVEAAGLQEQGTTTKAGNRVMQPGEYTGANVAQQASGFQPAEKARRQEEIYHLSRIDADARKAAAGFYRKLANSINLAEQHKDEPATAARFMRRFEDDLAAYQKRIDDPSLPDYVKFNISRQALKREIGNALDWSRRFRTGPKVARGEMARRLEIMQTMRQMGESVGERFE